LERPNVGGESTDVVLLVMNNRGVDALLSSEVKLGGSLSAAAGSKGRNAEASTDATLRAEILSYSRARGLFAGVSLEGTSLRPDDDARRTRRTTSRRRHPAAVSRSVRAPAGGVNVNQRPTLGTLLSRILRLRQAVLRHPLRADDAEVGRPLS
jgi:lipid-binding SYLF domain-containing protein